MWKRRIYLDYASLTPIDPRVERVMRQFSSSDFANPSSIYMEGVAAKKILDESRKRIGESIHAHDDEIVFTSGGTEANSLALMGVLALAREKIERPRLIISEIEHASIVETAKELERQGVEVVRVPVGKDGIVSLEDLKKSISTNTVLVSIMMVNNEIGTIQPIREVAKILRNSRASGSRYPLLHTDAAQALYLDCNVEKLGVDLLTLDGSKMYGPRGMGALYIKRGTPLHPIIHGGGQEKGRRSGTENVAAAAGLAEACAISQAERESEGVRLFALKGYFLELLKNVRPDIRVNPPDSRTKSVTQSPHILNVSIPGIDNEFFVLKLDALGVACSTKSSCLRDEDESYVLKAMGADSGTAVRFSFGRWTKKGQIERAILAISRSL